MSDDEQEQEIFRSLMGQLFGADAAQQQILANNAAQQLHNFYTAAQEVGFTKQQAFQLLLTMLGTWSDE